MLQKIQETAEFLKSKMTTAPETAIILGTGLGSLVNEITDKYEIKYEDIPNFPFQPLKDTPASSYSENLATRRLWLCRAVSTFTKAIL